MHWSGWGRPGHIPEPPATTRPGGQPVPVRQPAPVSPSASSSASGTAALVTALCPSVASRMGTARRCDGRPLPLATCRNRQTAIMATVMLRPATTRGGRRTQSGNVTEDHVRCQVCGRWYEAIAPAHLAKHGMTTADYIGKCGRLSFFSLSLRRRFSAGARARRTRQRRLGVYVPRLPEDVLADLKRLALRGNTVEKQRMAKVDASLITQAGGAFGSWSKAMRMAGLPVPERQERTEKSIKEAIKERVRQGKPLNSGAVQRDDANLHAAALRHFGSWRAALGSCGVDHDRIRRTRLWDRRSVEVALRAWAKGHGRLDYKELREGDSGLYQAADKFYGSLEKAGKKLRLKVHRHCVEWAKAGVIAEIRRLAESGEDLSASLVSKEHSSLYYAAIKRFEGWDEAIKAAGFASNRWRKSRNWDDRSLTHALRQWVKKHGPLRLAMLQRADAGLARIAIHRFGSLGAAAKHLRLPHQLLRRSWTKDEVLAAVRQRARRGERMIARAVYGTEGKVYAAGIRLFGSWAAVLKAASE